MSNVIWLLLMALAGWTVGKVVGGKRLGAVADILLGITGAMVVRFCLDTLRVTLQDVDELLFCVWGAAILPALFRFLIKRCDERIHTRASRNLGLSKTATVEARVCHDDGNDTSKAS